MAVGDVFVQGMHEFTILSKNPNQVRVRYIDNGDTSYSATLGSTVNYDNETWDVTSMDIMFAENYNLTSIDFSNVDTSKVTTMFQMFYNCSATTFNLLNVDTSNVISMKSMFERSRAVSLDLSNFDFSKVQNLNNMFMQCFKLTTIKFPSLNLSKVTENLGYLFYGCNKLTTNLPIIRWNQLASAPSSLFKDTSQPISIQIISNYMTSSELQRATQYWTSAAASYSNVYLTSAPTTAPIVSGQGRRGTLNSQNEFIVDEDEGRVIEIELQYTLDQTGVPVGKPNTIRRLTYTEGTTTSVPVFRNNKFYINLSNYDEAQHNYTITITDSYNNTGTTTIVVPGVFAMLDFYAGGKGMAIGKPATRNGLDVQYPTTIGLGLEPAKDNDEIDLTNYQLVVGKYNVRKNDGLFIIGNGESSQQRKNIFTVYNNGGVNINDNFTVNEVGDLSIATLNGKTFSVNTGKNEEIATDNFSSTVKFSRDNTTEDWTLVINGDSNNSIEWPASQDEIYVPFSFDKVFVDPSTYDSTTSVEISGEPSSELKQVLINGEYNSEVFNGKTYLYFHMRREWLDGSGSSSILIYDDDDVEISVSNREYYAGSGSLNFSDVFNVDTSGNIVANSLNITNSSLSLGNYVTSGYLTNASGAIIFSIPTGRVYPNGTTIKSISFNIVARIGNSDGAGVYLIKDSPDGTSAITFNSTSSSYFFNGANLGKILTPQMWRAVSLQGGTNIYLNLGTSDLTSYFFGSSSLNAKINNHPFSAFLGNIQVEFNIPS